MQNLDLFWFRRVLVAGVRHSDLHEHLSGHSETFRQNLFLEFGQILMAASSRPSITSFSVTDGSITWTIKRDGNVWIRSSRRAKSGRPREKQARNARIKASYPACLAAVKAVQLAIKRLPENSKRRRRMAADSGPQIEAFVLRLREELSDSNARTWLTDLGCKDGLVSYGLSENRRQLEFFWSDFVRGRFAPSDLAKASLGAWYGIERATVHKALGSPKMRKSTKETKSSSIRQSK